MKKERKREGWRGVETMIEKVATGRKAIVEEVQKVIVRVRENEWELE